MYCKSGNFRENFIFANIVQRHIYGAKYSRLGYDFSISVNESDFAILRGFYFHETSHAFAKIKPSRKFLNLQYLIEGLLDRDLLPVESLCCVLELHY